MKSVAKKINTKMKKVWTFIISKPLSEVELNALLNNGKTFINTWTAHENKLEASFEIYKNQVIIVKVNEQVYQASGCSIDKLTRFIKTCETEFRIELLNRLLVAYKIENDLKVVHSTKIKELLKSGEITENTIIFNTSVSNEQEFTNWEQKLSDTWLSKYLVNV